jgi:hypothetical protein
MAIQTLPFTVEVVTGQPALEDACDVRAAGYGHHLPHIRHAYAAPEALDVAPDTTVLVCYDKATGTALGTARIQTTIHGGKLPIETCIDLPLHMRQDGRAEITKLASIPGADPLVKLAIWKAGYLYCLANQARWLFIGARSRGLVRQYRRLGATAFHDDERMVPLTYAGGIPHQVLLFDVIAAERNWHAANHALFGFMFTTLHPDLYLFQKRNLPPAERAAPFRAAA